VIRIRVLADGKEVDTDSLFLVPSGACESRQGLRISLDGAWNGAARRTRTIELTVTPLDGRGTTTATTLLSVIVDAELTWKQ
jgi:hypothetical protein